MEELFTGITMTQHDNAIICGQEARTCIERYMSEVKKRGSKYLNIIRLEKWILFTYESW